MLQKPQSSPRCQPLLSTHICWKASFSLLSCLPRISTSPRVKSSLSVTSIRRSFVSAWLSCSCCNVHTHIPNCTAGSLESVEQITLDTVTKLYSRQPGVSGTNYIGYGDQTVQQAAWSQRNKLHWIRWPNCTAGSLESVEQITLDTVTKLYSRQPGVSGTNYIGYGDTRGTVLPNDNLLKHTHILTPSLTRIPTHPIHTYQHIPYTHPNTSLTRIPCIQTHPLRMSKQIPYTHPNTSHTHIQTHPLRTSHTHIPNCTAHSLVPLEQITFDMVTYRELFYLMTTGLNIHTSHTVRHTAWCHWNKLHLIW